jgi:heme a synthase
MEFSGSKGRKRFAFFAWAVLAYNIPVILWGAYVRISFSGDGCGAHWPFCAGQVLPQHMATPTLIEFTHRMMTSLDTMATIALCVWAFRAFPKRHAVRSYALWSLVFLFVEALLGAGLVLLRYVAHDQSAGRAVYLSAHLTNTMLLLGAFTMTAWLVQTNTERVRWENVSRVFAVSLLVTVVVSITGAIAALGDTLFPAASLAEGMRQDFSSGSSLLLRLRMFHPVLAVLGAAYLLWAASGALKREDHAAARIAGMRVLALIVLQILAGAVNLSLMAPVWMQLFHLLMADALWIAVVLMVMETSVARGARERELIAVSQ